MFFNPLVSFLLETSRRIPIISDISRAAEELIHKHIFSVSQLETLLLLERTRQKHWTAAEVARELYTNPDASLDALRQLTRSGFLHTEDGAPTRFYFSPHDGITAEAVGDLVHAYAERRLRVVDMIFNKQSSNIRDFADAFKFKKENEQ